MQVIKPRWENAKETAKDIFEQTLRQLMPSLSNKEVKYSMKKNEKKLTLKFNTFLVMIKDIKSVVKTTTTTWKNIYKLHKLDDFFVHVSDQEDEEEIKEDNDHDDE